VLHANVAVDASAPHANAVADVFVNAAADVKRAP